MLRGLILFALATCAFSSLNFLALGDWGGDESSPYTTSAQIKTAAAMNMIAEKINSQFVLAIGDNFYSHGLPGDETNSRFVDTFENVYTGSNLQTPWYVIAGNHDHLGNVTAQIEYSKHSSRWTFPDEYHTHSHKSDDGVTVDIIMIDTIDVAGAPAVPEGHVNYFDPLPEVDRAQVGQSWVWIENQLKASTAQYILVAGHYPVYSICSHGPTSTLITNLKPLLEKYGAHMISGHEHCQEHIQEAGSKVNYLITGMGMECCYFPTNKNKVNSEYVKFYIAGDNAPKGTSGGFASLTATSTEMTVTFYDQDGSVQYITPPIAPRF